MPTIKDKYSQETITVMKAATLGLIRKIERENLVEQDAQDVYEELSDYMRVTYPEFTSDQNDDCVYYAMQASLF